MLTNDVRSLHIFFCLAQYLYLSGLCMVIDSKRLVFVLSWMSMVFHSVAYVAWQTCMYCCWDWFCEFSDACNNIDDNNYNDNWDDFDLLESWQVWDVSHVTVICTTALSYWLLHPRDRRCSRNIAATRKTTKYSNHISAHVLTRLWQTRAVWRDEEFEDQSSEVMWRKTRKIVTNLTG